VSEPFVLKTLWQMDPNQSSEADGYAAAQL